MFHILCNIQGCARQVMVLDYGIGCSVGFQKVLHL